MGRVEGKVAFITGAARGQGRSHAIRLAEEGADIIAVDICDKVVSNIAPPASEEDLAATVKEVEARGRRALSYKVDVRDLESLQSAVDEAVAELGRLDIVCANAGSWTYGLAHELSTLEWRETIDIVLTGAWHTCKVSVPHLIRQGNGGSVILTSSVLGLKGSPNIGHYVAAKHGVVGLMRTMALELAPHRIRVNTVNPGTVNTALIHNESTYRLFGPDLADPTRDEIVDRMKVLTPWGLPYVEPEDITAGVLYLACDESRYVTGTTLVIDAGTKAM